MNLFYKESKSKKSYLGEGDERKEKNMRRWGGGWDKSKYFFFTKNTIFFLFVFFGWVGGEGVQLVNFFSKNPNLKEVVGVLEYVIFLQRIQI